MPSKVTSKGQVTVPKKIRDYLGLQSGSTVGFLLGAQGEVILRPTEPGCAPGGRGQFNHLRGTLTTGKSTDELMQLLRGYKADARDPGLR